MLKGRHARKVPSVSWYAAHNLMRIRFRDGLPGPLYVMENVVLLEAATPDAARLLAHARGEADSNESDSTFRCDERPAFWHYAGTRQILSAEDQHERPASGTEITYLEYRVETEADLAKLLAGEGAFVELG